MQGNEVSTYGRILEDALSQADTAEVYIYIWSHFCWTAFVVMGMIMMILIKTTMITIIMATTMVMMRTMIMIVMTIP